MFRVFPIILLLFVNCAMNKDVLRRQDAKGFIVADDREGKSQTFYIIEPVQLLKAHKVSSLTYLGSTDQYCLMKVWNILAVKKDEIELFAVDRKNCIVENERSPAQEKIVHPQYTSNIRHVEIKDGKCVVSDRKDTSP